MTRYDIAMMCGYNSVEEYDEAERRNNEILEFLKKQKPSNCISHGILSPEEQEVTTLKRYLELMSKKIKEMYGYTDKEYDAYRQGLKDCARCVGVREYDFDSREYDLDSSGDDNKEYYHYEISDDMEG